MKPRELLISVIVAWVGAGVMHEVDPPNYPYLDWLRFAFYILVGLIPFPKFSPRKKE